MSASNSNREKVALLKYIRSLIDCLVNIKDESSEFLLTLEDGRVIDTKGWNDWEVRGLVFLRSAIETASTVDARNRPVRSAKVQ
jgi:hypothetical protein